EDVAHRDLAAAPEATPKEWHDKLKSLIEKAKLGATATKEKMQWWKSAEEELIRRNAELDQQAEKLGGVERWFRYMGERYNKLSFTKKVLIGAGLGVGAVATAGSIAMVAPMLGIAAQRVAGFSTMYLKFEKKWHDEAWGKNKEWGKQKALLSAGLYTALMGLTMKEAIDYASSTEMGHALQAKTSEFAHAAHEKITNWLGAVLHQQYGPDGNPIIGNTGSAGPSGSASTPAAHAAAPAVGAEPSAVVSPEAMKIDVAASKGHGAEYMMKRLWEQMQEKDIKLPENADHNSDLWKLAHADKNTIDGVVHKIAMEPRNTFFHADGTNVLINPDSHMTIDARGNISLSHIDAGKVTPAYHPEVAAHASIDSEIKMTEEPVTPLPDTPPFAHPDAVPTPLERVSVDSAPVAHVEDATVLPSHEYHSIVNAAGIEVSSTEPHIYSDGKSFMVFGGLPKDQQPLMLNYLKAHTDATVFSADTSGKYRMSWKLVAGKLVGEPEKLHGFMGMFGSLAPAPAPEEFTKVVE
ncbi:MAG TPA: hypothetical protein VF803_03865, partial [Candidatus Paceibacterota bacterium]